jgi:hypothetical protein
MAGCRQSRYDSHLWSDCNSAKTEDTENSKTITGMFSRSFSAIGHQVAVTSFHVPVQRVVANIRFGADEPL